MQISGPSSCRLICCWEMAGTAGLWLLAWLLSLNLPFYSSAGPGWESTVSPGGKLSLNWFLMVTESHGVTVTSHGAPSDPAALDSTKTTKYTRFRPVLGENNHKNISDPSNIQNTKTFESVSKLIFVHVGVPEILITSRSDIILWQVLLNQRI